MRILILCTGNSCRSQMAEGILKSLDSNLEVLSAGTKPAAKVASMAIEVMKEIGLDISQNYPKLVDNFLTQEFDYVITVCGGAKEVCPAFIGKVAHRIHIGFDDPWEATGSDEEQIVVYRRVRDEILRDFKEFYSNNIVNNIANNIK